MSESEKKNAIQKYNAELVEPSEGDSEIFRSFAGVKKQEQSKKDQTRPAASSGLRAEIIKVEGELIRTKNEMGVLQQQLDERDQALDHIKSIEDKSIHKLAKRHGIIFESDLESRLTRKILFKLTNYLVIAGGIIIALMSGSNPSIQAAVDNVTKNPIEIIGVLAFVSLDLYLFFTWYRRA